MKMHHPKTVSNLTAARRRHVLMDALEPRRLLANIFPTPTGLQAAIDSAQLGDTIILQAGTTYPGAITLKNKTTGTGMITIQSSNLAQLPGAGVRVSPADAANMPIIRAPGSNELAIKTQDYAHNYQFTGIQFVGPSNNSDLVTLIQIGNDSQTDPAVVPNHINFDRCYCRPNVPSANIRRAFGLHANYVDVTNSYVENIHEGSDSNAIAGWNGLGHYNIINNHLEGAGENILFGGATNHMPQPISDVVIRGNHIMKPLYWRDGSKGFTATVKNLFELKQGARFTVENNIFENCWTSGQTGVAILLKLGDYDTSPANVTEDITFRNNIVRHANGGITFQGRDYASNSPPGLVRRLTISNNLWDDINGKWDTSMTGNGTFFMYMTHGPQDITFEHNTIRNGYTAIEVDSNLDPVTGYPATNFKYRNNIVNHSLYGVRSPEGVGNPVFTKYFTDPGFQFDKNVLINTPYGYRNAYSTRPNNFLMYQSGDPDLTGNVGFIDRANGNFRLATTSPYHNAATDGTDVGANFDAIPLEFAYMTGTTLNVRFDLIANAPLPILLNINGSSITASYDGTTLNFTGVTNIAAVGTAADDHLQLTGGTSTLPITFNNGAGNDTVDVLGGSIAFSGDIGGAGRNVALSVASNAAAIFNSTQHLRDLNIAANAIATLSAGGNKVLVTKSLSALLGKLNLTNNDMVIDYDPNATSPIGAWNSATSSYTGITGLIQSGRHGGDYAGNGIVTDQADAISPNIKTSLGVSEAKDSLTISGTATAMFGTEPVDASSVLVKYTYSGDADLNGTINSNDYFLIDVAFLAGNQNTWFQGDFDYNGAINSTDYFMIDLIFGQQGLPL